MISKESFEKAQIAFETWKEVGLDIEDLFDPDGMSETRKIAVALAVTGEFDDQVKQITKE